MADVAVEVTEAEDLEFEAGDVGVPGKAAGWRLEVEGIDLRIDFAEDEVDVVEEFGSGVRFCNGGVAFEVSAVQTMLAPRFE